ncbi:MAG: glycine cleavage system protein GcvH [Spirochaetaceae bacterium]|nr:glycine cleavage system protein GcvH [Spirochaetaceae bacterium]
MSIPEDLRYTAEHEWLRQDGEIAVIGITNHAQGELGDVVYVELPEVGSEIVQGESFGVIESVKAASDLYAPISGEITAVNGDLEAAPQRVNESPYDGGWLIKVRPSRFADEQSGLLDATAYAALLP